MRKDWLLLLGVVVSVTCLFAKTVADYDHSVSFGKYHTYSWIGVPACGKGLTVAPVDKVHLKALTRATA